MAIIYNGSSISWAFILYIVVSVTLGLQSIKYYYGKGQPIAAMSLLVLLILVFIFYQLRWFTNFQLKGTTAAAATTGGSWPPIVNMCPDFMAAWTDPATKKVYCYDSSNLYNLSSAVTGITNGLTINGNSGQVAFMTKNPSSSGNPQNLTNSDAASRWPFLSALSKGAIPLTDPSMRYMRWEGVWDGRTLSVANAPLP
jgi:hypothetical protein